MTEKRSGSRPPHPADSAIVKVLLKEGIAPVLSLPCNMLAGLLREIDQHPVQHIKVCREEEGVGIAAGAALAGKKSLLLMQNSGLGNTINALMSLTRLYQLPLFLLMSHRGGPGEKISAQIPMGEAAPRMLDALGIRYVYIHSAHDFPILAGLLKKTYSKSLISAAFLSRGLWDETK
jgi:sulfopyruvate decarboxylase subunit alpha